MAVQALDELIREMFCPITKLFSGLAAQIDIEAVGKACYFTRIPRVMS